jgi:hypothetical protein
MKLLNRCHFCRSKTELYARADFPPELVDVAFVECPKCGARSPQGSTPAEAIKLHNRGPRLTAVGQLAKT